MKVNLVRVLLPGMLTAVLSACGGSGAPATPAIAPTEVAAVNTPPPDYPIRFACEGIGGVSTLKVLIGTEGKPTDVSVVKSSGQPQLDDLAVKAVRDWQFKPATRNGQPISTTIQVPVNFQPPAERPQECFALDAQRDQG